MKKWFVGILLILIAGFVICIYLIIPSHLIITRTIPVLATQEGTYRVLSNQAKWMRWWRNAAGQPSEKASSLMYNGYTFRLTKHQQNFIGVEITKGDFKLNSIIHVLNFRYDSTLVIWKSDSMYTGMDPISRLFSFSKAVKISEGMQGALKNFKPFVDSPENVYNGSIYKASTRDTFLLSARFTSVSYPATAEIYGYFDAVKKEIIRQKGIPISSPLLDVQKLKADSFETQVAIPTNIKLKDAGITFYRRMEPGNFMAVEVRGGTNTVDDAIKQLHLYILDYGKVQMAKGFQILETDRTQEPDTLKWLTKIYIPVVE